MSEIREADHSPASRKQQLTVAVAVGLLPCDRPQRGGGVRPNTSLVLPLRSLHCFITNIQHRQETRQGNRIINHELGGSLLHPLSLPPGVIGSGRQTGGRAATTEAAAEARINSNCCKYVHAQTHRPPVSCTPEMK